MSRNPWSPQELQHFAGLWGFAAAFRRPLFSVLEATCSSTGDALVASQQVICPQVRLEILAAAALLGSPGISLRAPVRSVISCSDASGTGGSASEARNVLWYRAHKLENEVDFGKSSTVKRFRRKIIQCMNTAFVVFRQGFGSQCIVCWWLLSFFMCSLALGINVPKAD